MKRLIVFLLVSAMLIQLASASTHCPCGRPGKPGHNIKFVARTGTTDNVTFYKDAEPELGKTLLIWAAKTVESDTLPIENLNVTLYLNSEEIDEKVTDAEGSVKFQIDEPGSYLMSGGDAEFEFNISEALDVAEPPALNETMGNTSAAPIVEEAKNDSIGGGTPEPSDNNIPTAGRTYGTDMPDWQMWVLATAIIAVALILTKKCFPRRKSSAISGKRRG